ncbi:MAG TPA: MFS transporter [Verrucomicrobiota bacterium]|nr:MFS transporter [Verrucomicrobiota bacterium]
MKKPTLFIVFLTVFIDVVGFSIIFPLFPAMLDYYLELDGKESLIGSLVVWLGQFAGDDRNAVATLFGGVIGSLYGFLQFVFAPIWGAYSDRHGRRPTLVFTLGGIVLANLIWVFAGSFVLLVLGRTLGGIMAGNISTASAVAADITTGKNRASGMILIGVALGLGFILGPAIGGLAYGWQLVEAGNATPGLALHPFSGPAIIALAIAAVNWVLIIFRLSESLPPEKRGQSTAKSSFNPFAQLRRINLPGVAHTNLMYFAYWSAFSSVEFTITFFATETLKFTPFDIAWMFVFIGVSLIFFQGAVARQLIRHLGERRTALFGVCSTLPGFLIIGNATSTTMLYGGLLLMTAGSGMTMPSLNSLVSRYTPGDRQGLSLGVFRSLGSLSRALGPIMGGLLYWKFSSSMPYWVGAAFLVVPLFMALGLPPVPDHDEVSGKQ